MSGDGQRIGARKSDLAPSNVGYYLAAHQFVASLSDFDPARWGEVLERNPDPLSGAWQLWAVDQVLAKRGILPNRMASLAAAVDHLGAADLAEESKLALAELLSAMGTCHVQRGDGGLALPFFEAAHALWTALVDDAIAEVRTGSGRHRPSVSTMCAVQLRSLGVKLSERSSQHLRQWLVERPAHVMGETFKSIVSLVGTNSGPAAARASADDAHKWLDQRYVTARVYTARAAHYGIFNALGDIEWLALENDAALRAHEAADALVRDLDTEADRQLSNAVRLHLAPRLAQAGREYEALELLAALEDWVYQNREQAPEIGFRARSAQCFARWRLHADKTVEADVRRLVSDWERHLEKSEVDFGTPSGFARKAHLTGAYRLLLTILAENPRTPIGDYSDVLCALRDAERISALDDRTAVGRFRSRAGLPGVLEVIPGYLRDGECALFAEWGAERLTFAVVEAGGVSLSVDSPDLRRAVNALWLGYKHRSAQAVAGIDTGDEESLETLGSAVWRTLPEPVRTALGRASTVYYSPDPLSDTDEMPLELVCSPGGLLGATTSISRLRSPQAVVRQLAPRPLPIPQSEDGRVLLAQAPAEYPELIIGHTEAANVERFMGLLGLHAERGEVASAEELAAALAKPCRVLHYVGHGVADQLSESAAVGADEGLIPDRLPVLPSDPVCVFSCCELARIRFIHGGGSRSFTDALLEQGARTVVAYTQPVPDQHAIQLSREFYRASRTEPVGVAVAHARSKAIAHGIAPAVAASLVVTGDPHAKLTGAEPITHPDWPTIVLRSIALDDPPLLEVAAAHLPAAPWSRALARWLRGKPPQRRKQDELVEAVRSDNVRGASALRILLASERLAELPDDGSPSEIAEAQALLEDSIAVADLLDERLPRAALTVAYVQRAGERAVDPVIVGRLALAVGEIRLWTTTLNVETLNRRARRLMMEVAVRQSGSADGDAADASTTGLEMYNQGVRYLNEGKVPEACSALREAVASKHPEAAPRAALLLGQTLADQGDSAGARAPLELARASGDPQIAPQASIKLGLIAVADSEQPLARSLFEETIASEHPEFAPMAAVNLGQVLEMQGDVGGALEAYEYALQNGGPPVAARASYLIAFAMHGAGLRDEARQYYEHALGFGDAEVSQHARNGLAALDNLAARDRRRSGGGR